jgi:hypothetical protein
MAVATKLFTCLSPTASTHADLALRQPINPNLKAIWVNWLPAGAPYLAVAVFYHPIGYSSISL